MVEVSVVTNFKTRVRRRSTDALKPALFRLSGILSGLFLLVSFAFITKSFLGEQKQSGAKQIFPEKNLRWEGRETQPTGPITTDSVLEVFQDFLKKFRDRMKNQKEGLTNYERIWKIYHDLVMETLYPWDQHYLQNMPKRRDDDSIFVSMASYRDENCLSTIRNAYLKAANPEKLNIGLVQQNCEEDCKSGVLDHFKVESVEPDDDCHRLFCESEEGRQHCREGRVRALHINETESLGPYAARYFASKLWDGESWFLQIDSHMGFAERWDADSVAMLQKAPSKKPVVSHYPTDANANFKMEAKMPAPRICGPVFAGSAIEYQIIRLEGSNVYDKKRIDIPRFAPFVAAGYFVAHSDFLKEVPFDPLLPWIFMGEEIIMSARFWTHGYDIFSPTHSVVGHIYVRRHKPKFWETIGRLYWPGVHNLLTKLVMDRIKFQLKYPESDRDMIPNKSVLTGVERYTMGTKRPIEDYLAMVGLDPITKTIVNTRWCETGQPPEYAAKHANLYKPS